MCKYGISPIAFFTSHIEPPYYNEKFNFYKKPPNNSMWYAVTRSGNWLRVKNGIYKKK
jgi:biotin synthase-related radical SAM superfamily protein